MRLSVLRRIACLVAVSTLSAALCVGQQTTSMQLPADQQAFKDARAIVDPAQRIAALEKFVHNFPQSKRVGPARDMVLTTLLQDFPTRLHEIRKQAKSIIENAAAGEDRLDKENEVAYDLAEVLPNGVDLGDADKWARDAVKEDTRVAMAAAMKASSEKYHFPMPTAAEIDGYYGMSQAANLQTLADVLFHEGKLDEASMAVSQGVALDTTQGSLYLTRGQIALARHQDAEALSNFELAELYGGMTAAVLPDLQRLYRSAHNGTATGFDAEMDARYKKLFPLPYTPTPHAAPPTGRTVLMELFTGSGCHPCASADLTMEGVLDAYPRGEVVALSFDQHIPLPDPLANADTVARADFYGVNSTPTAFLDGQMTENLGGGTRDDSKNFFPKVVSQIDKQLNTPTGIELSLHAMMTPAHTIEVSAETVVSDPKLVQKAIETKGPAAASAAGKTEPASSVEPSAKLVVNFALVQRSVRYSGENGIRFHSMIVRAVARPSPEGFDIASTGKSRVESTFDPAAISQSLSRYLAAYEKHSDRFGETRFTYTDTALPLDELAVVAWVEDPASHHVLQAAYVPVTSGDVAIAEKKAAH